MHNVLTGKVDEITVFPFRTASIFLVSPFSYFFLRETKVRESPSLSLFLLFRTSGVGNERLAATACLCREAVLGPKGLGGRTCL